MTGRTVATVAALLAVGVGCYVIGALIGFAVVDAWMQSR